MRSFGWVRWLLLAWVAIGVGAAIYAVVSSTHLDVDQNYRWFPQWPGEPQAVVDVGVVAGPAWALLSLPLLAVGLFQLRCWRARNLFRAVGWVVSWLVGWALMNQAWNWVMASETTNRGALSVGEVAIGVAWLAPGAAMTWMLAVPTVRRAEVTTTELRGSAEPK